MNEKQAADRESSPATIARSLGHSRNGRIALSMGVAALPSLLAYGAWRNPESSAYLLAITLLSYGLTLAWRT